MVTQGSIYAVCFYFFNAYVITNSYVWPLVEIVSSKIAKVDDEITLEVSIEVTFTHLISSNGKIIQTALLITSNRITWNGMDYSS